MNEGGTGFLLQFTGLGVGVVVSAGHQAHLRAQALGGLYLADGGAVRHTDHALNAVLGGSQGHALCMIAGAAGDDAAGLFLFGQLADLVVSAAHFEAASHLKVFGFQVDVAVGRQVGGGDQVGFAGDVFQNKGGVIDFVQSDHGEQFSFSSFQ